ncbi:MAG: hypothetical protein IAE86_21650 [Burkholderiaceae bacterium]|nr:hypothetical protein [Burkholderiaceae bacterium]
MAAVPRNGARGARPPRFVPTRPTAIGHRLLGLVQLVALPRMALMLDRTLRSGADLDALCSLPVTLNGRCRPR